MNEFIRCRKKILGFISHIVACNQSVDSNDYEWKSLSNTYCKVGVDVVNDYVNQTGIVDESLAGSDAGSC